jgi:ATP synthase protein I
MAKELGESRSKASFDERLKTAKSRLEAEKGRPDRARRMNSRGMGVGFRIAVEMISALAVGVGIGIGLDQWWGSTPWMMILFFILGAGAAFLNVIRVAKEYDRKMREEREKRIAGGEKG